MPPRRVTSGWPPTTPNVARARGYGSALTLPAWTAWMRGAVTGSKGVVVCSASGGAALVTRHARGARGDAAKIGAALSEIWSDKLRYREAHEVTLADDCSSMVSARSAQANSGSPPRSWLSRLPDRHQAASGADLLRNPCGIRPDRASPRSAKTPGSTRESGGFGERRGSDVVVELELVRVRAQPYGVDVDPLQLDPGLD